MATGLLGGVLPYIYSRADALKRTLGDVVSNPMASTEQVVNYANDRARYLNQLNAQVASQGLKGLMSPQGKELANLYTEAYNPVGMTAKNLSYRGSHTAPSPEFGAPLHDLTGGGQMYPADVYSEKAVQYYGSGNRKADTEAFNLAKRVRGNPDAEVTMYRAVPNNADITNINAGDWVTLSKEYAKNHGESVLGNDYKILSQKVKAKELWTNADSIQEFGYQPESLTKQLSTSIENPTFTDPFGNTIGSSIR